MAGLLSGGKTVLFNSTRPLGRCENLTAVFNAYDGEKVFVQGGFRDYSTARENVIVTDEFLSWADKPRQKVVMIAHGLTGGKLYGNDQPDGIFVGKEESTALVDWYVTSSEHGRRFAASASGIPIERCLPLGMPRTDAYFGKKRGDGGTPFARRYKRVYLYAPTFRSPYNEPQPDIDWHAIDELLEPDECVVVKRHMKSPGSLTGGSFGHVFEVENSIESTPYLIDCDVLATDFSSILFDGYVLGKPSVLTATADDDYLKVRGMYMDYPSEYSSRAVNMRDRRNARMFVDELRHAAAVGMHSVECECRRKVADKCDGHSAERVCDLVRKLVDEL